MNMFQIKLRLKVDKLIELAVQLHAILEQHEQRLLEGLTHDLGQDERVQINGMVRKRCLRYFIQDTNHYEFRALWFQYQQLYRELYLDFRRQSGSPTNDELFASREIIEDALVEVSDQVTFKYVFLQKAYAAFSIDFKEVAPQITDISLFNSELGDDNSDDGLLELKSLIIDDSRVCCLM
jgi:hypothetical protein